MNIDCVLCDVILSMCAIPRTRQGRKGMSDPTHDHLSASYSLGGLSNVKKVRKKTSFAKDVPHHMFLDMAARSVYRHEARQEREHAKPQAAEGLRKGRTRKEAVLPPAFQQLLTNAKKAAAMHKVVSRSDKGFHSRHEVDNAAAYDVDLQSMRGISSAGPENASYSGVSQNQMFSNRTYLLSVHSDGVPQWKEKQQREERERASNKRLGRTMELANKQRVGGPRNRGRRKMSISSFGPPPSHTQSLPRHGMSKSATLPLL
jgi:hypothetical protein